MLKVFFFVTGNGSVCVLFYKSAENPIVHQRIFFILSYLLFEEKGVHWISHTSRVMFCHAFGFCRQVTLVPLYLLVGLEFSLSLM
jgi:hypothetical protein